MINISVVGNTGHFDNEIDHPRLGTLHTLGMGLVGLASLSAVSLFTGEAVHSTGICVRWTRWIRSNLLAQRARK